MSIDFFAYRETVEDIFTFVNEVILPSIVDHQQHGNFLFRINCDSEYDASAVLLKPGLFRISINTGLVELVVKLLETDLAENDSVLFANIEKLLDLELEFDQHVNLVLVSAIVFVLLHEVYHAISGHCEFWADHIKKKSNADRAMAESNLGELHLLPDNFLSIMELEADGSAYATTLEFAPHIYATVTDSQPFPDEYRNEIEQSVILGSLSALAALNEIVPVQSQNGDSVHFPQMRILNACSANYRTMAEPSYSTVDGDPYVPRDLNDKDASAVANRYFRTIVPAIVTLDKLLARHFGVTRFLAVSEKDPTGLNSPFMMDIRHVLSGTKPTQTAPGRAFALLIPSRVKFMKRLASYRRADLW